MKVLTFEEWYEKEGQAYVEEVVRKSWNAAREGMIPAGRAIEVPHYSTWRRVANLDRYDQPIGYVVVGFPTLYTKEGQEEDKPRFLKDGTPLDYLGYVPAPTWTPKIDEPVFALSLKQEVWVAKVNSMNNGVPVIVCSDGGESAWGLNHLKPFDASKIGKSWDEIPGGLE